MCELVTVVGDAGPSLLVLKRQPKCCSAHVFLLRRLSKTTSLTD